MGTMELKQQLKLSQQLVMTPQLQQAIKLLQISRAELVDLVRQELLENPVLEDHAETQELRADKAVTREGASDGTNFDQEAAPAVNTHDQGGAREIDWERYLENQSLQAPAPYVRYTGSEDEMSNGDGSLTERENLAGHLIWQLRMADLTDEELKFSHLVIGNLDDHGYLKLEDVEESEVVPTLAKEADLDPEDAEEILKMIQRLDPIGVAARSLTECLLIQAEHYQMDPLVHRVIREHLCHLERRNYQAVATACNVSMEEVLDVAQAIMELDPKPGRYYQEEDPQYITPDVYVHKVGDQYFVVANDDGLPKLKISRFYRSALQGDDDAKEYVKNKLRSAQWLIRSIDQRRKTIVRVTESLVERQKDFFEKGVEFLRPMTLRDVAEEVGLHESTISRVTSNKYVHTPRGIFELKYFFSTGIRREADDDIASESVKQSVKRLVSEEDPKNPLSDQQLVDKLSQQKIVIARRTVAKYREALGILSSSKRKKYF